MVLSFGANSVDPDHTAPEGVYHTSLVKRKPGDQGRLKPACAATEAR